MHSKQEYQEAIETSSSIKEVVEKLFGVGSLQYRTYHTNVKLYELEALHVSLKDRFKRTLRPANKILTDEELFSKNHTRRTNSVRYRVLKKNLIDYICAVCGQEPIWNGSPMCLDLDHIDGNFCNNELSNLRFICGHCDRQQTTYKSRNMKRVPKEKAKYFCSICLKQVSSSRHEFCMKCAGKARPKPINLPHKVTLSKEELELLCQEHSYKTVGKMFGVTAHAIRFHADKFGIIKKRITQSRYPDKEELERLIAELPMTKIGEMFGVSDNAIRKQAKKMGIELPDRRGYWAKLKADKGHTIGE